VQRRSQGGIWVVACGLSGPATYGAARAIKDMTNLPPIPTKREHSASHLAIVETWVKRDRKNPAHREFVRSSIIAQHAAE
jgi:hypothetical protein